MVYDWSDKEKECYRLYVKEGKQLKELMQHFKTKYGFEPSKRAFQTNFKKWGFPTKQRLAHKDEALVERVRQLWEANATQQAMLSTLQALGFDINDRDLTRVRVKQGWMLRGANGYQPTHNKQRSTPNTEHDREQDDSRTDQVQSYDHGYIHDTPPKPLAQTVPDTSAIHASPSDVQLQKEQRRRELEAESTRRWATKKRRRHTRGFAGIPADPPGPPRFPSETTLDESKAFLHLNNDIYLQMRDQFTKLCHENDVVKKTICGPERWQSLKDQLVTQNDHLDKEFHGPFNGVPEDRKSLALDIICTNFTKRIRTMSTNMNLPDAKNVLGLNPSDSRALRSQFYDILSGDHFTSKFEAGHERWSELKNTWIRDSEILQKILATSDPSTAQYHEKHKAIDVLCRDVMKRLRADQTKKDPSIKKVVNVGPGPGPASRGGATAESPGTAQSPCASLSISKSLAPRPRQVKSDAMSPARSKKGHASIAAYPRSKVTLPPQQKQPLQDDDQSQERIDPSLLAAASDPALALQAFAAAAALNQDQGQQLEQQHVQPVQHTSFEPFAPTAPMGMSYPHSHSTQTAAAAQSPTMTKPCPIGALFRLHPASPVQLNPKVWMATLQGPYLSELMAKAMSRHANCLLRLLVGVLPDGGEFPIERDDELGAYLECVRDSRAVFLVVFGLPGNVERMFTQGGQQGVRHHEEEEEEEEYV